MCLYHVRTHHTPGSLKRQKREQKDEHEFFHCGVDCTSFALSVPVCVAGGTRHFWKMFELVGLLAWSSFTLYRYMTDAELHRERLRCPWQYLRFSVCCRIGHNVDRQAYLAARERPDMQIMNTPYTSHGQQRGVDCVDIDVLWRALQEDIQT